MNVINRTAIFVYCVGMTLVVTSAVIKMVTGESDLYALGHGIAHLTSANMLWMMGKESKP